ncbi:MAG: EthD family reductase [Acidimicrobiales bacterium]
MSVKLTVVYDNPTDPAAFEEHYRTTHVPLAGKVQGVRRAELAKVFPKEDGSPTPAYRVAELYFDDYQAAVAAIETKEGQALLADAQQLGSAGVKFLLCDIEIS